MPPCGQTCRRRGRQGTGAEKKNNLGWGCEGGSSGRAAFTRGLKDETVTCTEHRAEGPPGASPQDTLSPAQTGLLPTWSPRPVGRLCQARLYPRASGPPQSRCRRVSVPGPPGPPEPGLPKGKRIDLVFNKVKCLHMREARCTREGHRKSKSHYSQGSNSNRHLDKSNWMQGKEKAEPKELRERGRKCETPESVPKPEAPALRPHQRNAARGRPRGSCSHVTSTRQHQPPHPHKSS